MKSTFLTLLLAAVFLGCGKQPEPRHIVILPDVSGSIDPKALEQAFKAIDELVSHLHRGDQIAILPIWGDAQAEASGRIIRFQVPTARQAYDSDLRAFRTKLKASLEEMEAAAVAHPGSKTDILGSVVLAGQEFQSSSDSDQSKRQLVILSDFIQEDRELNFDTDMRLRERVGAKKFAGQIAKANTVDFKRMPVYLGLLRSSTYAGIGRIRREAIREFWVEYFKTSGAQPRFVIDGPGQIESINFAFI
jgi:hypothetical protein